LTDLQIHVKDQALTKDSEVLGSHFCVAKRFESGLRKPLLFLERLCGVQFSLRRIEDAIISGFDQDLCLDPDLMFEIIAQVPADIPVDLLLDRVAPFVKRLLVLDHEILHSFRFPLAKVFLQAVERQYIANGRQKYAQKEYFEREVFH
jgi:hypothetical protein